MRRQTQITQRYHVTLAAQIRATHHIPQSAAHVKAAVGQARHATRQQRVGSALAPHGQIGPGTFIEIVAAGIHCAELTAALQIGLHNRSDFLWRLRIAPKRGNGDRQLGQSHARDLDPELRPGRKCCQRAQATSHSGKKAAAPRRLAGQ